MIYNKLLKRIKGNFICKKILYIILLTNILKVNYINISTFIYYKIHAILHEDTNLD